MFKPGMQSTIASGRLVVFCALAGFTVIANAGPHTGHDSRGISHDYRRGISWSLRAVSPLPVYRDGDHYGDSYYERNSSWRHARHGAGLYRFSARGHWGSDQYFLYDQGWNTRDHSPGGRRHGR